MAKYSTTLLTKTKDLLRTVCLATGAALLSAWATLCVLLVAGVLAAPAFAQTNGPFNCDVVFYQVRNHGGTPSTDSQLFKFAKVDATVTPQAVYTTTKTIRLNALGYNPTDNFMYAIDSTITGLPVLYRVGSIGYDKVGTITNTIVGGTALTSFVPTAGVFDAAGRYYFAGQNTNIVPAAVFRVDSLPLAGTMTVAHQYNLTPTAIINFGDFDFNGAGGPNGLLLGATGGNLYRLTLAENSVNPALGTATVQTLGLVGGVGGVGSAFYDAFTGRFYTYDNGANTFSEITGVLGATPGVVPTIVPAYSGTPTWVNADVTPTDGTSCPISGSRVAEIKIFKSDFVGTVTANSVTSYQITATNAGPYPANYATIRDPAAPGLTKLSVTCSAPGGPPSAVCPGALTTTTFEAGNQIIIWPPGTSLVFTVNALVTAAPGTNVTNTATLSASIDFTATATSILTAVDVDAVVAPTVPIRVVSAASQCPANTAEVNLNKVINGDFATGSILPSTSGATTLTLNTVGALNFVSPQNGAQSYYGVFPAAGVYQQPFIGDISRNIAGSNNWLLSRGKAAAATHTVWQQVIGGLVPGVTYQAMFYASNATQPGSASGTVPNLQLQYKTQTGVVTTVAGTTATYSATGGKSSNEIGTPAPGTDTWTLVQGVFVPNFGTVTLSIADLNAAVAPTGDAVALSQINLRACLPAADVSVTKTDNTTTVSSMSTTAYVIVLNNASAVNATTTQVNDLPATNLAKQTVTCVASAGSTCPASLTVFELENSGLIVPLVASGGKVTLTVVALVSGAPSATATNIVTITPLGYTDTDLSNNQAQDVNTIQGNATITIAKNNGVNTLVAGSTTSYTVTIANAGPSTLINSVFKDPQVAGLSCTSVTCSSVGPAFCPAPASVTIGDMQGAGITLGSLSPNSSVLFTIVCGVTATGRN